MPSPVLLRIVGVLLAVVGGVWLLQGVGVLPGSFMTGQTQWAVYGAIALALGIGLVVYGNRRRRG